MKAKVVIFFLLIFQISVFGQSTKQECAEGEICYNPPEYLGNSFLANTPDELKVESAGDKQISELRNMRAQKVCEFLGHSGSKRAESDKGENNLVGIDEDGSPVQIYVPPSQATEMQGSINASRFSLLVCE